MAVSIVVTAETVADTLPRVRIDLDTGDPAVAFSEITIYRDGVPIRAAAPVGSQTSTTYDYDCPYGQAVTYTAKGSRSGFASVLDEDWSDLAGWTDEGGAAVAGGKLSAGAVFRGQSPTRRLVLHDAASLVGTMSYISGLVTLFRIIGDGTNIVLQSFNNAGDLIWSVATVAGSGDWVLTDNQVTSSVGTWTLPGVPNPAASVLECTAVVPGLELFEAGSPTAFSLTQAGFTLDAQDAWLIHPTDLDLSVRISNGTRRDRIFVTSESAKDVTYDEQREVFKVLGRSKVVPVAYGDRLAGDWTLVLFSPRAEDRAAIRSLLSDQSVILLRVPGSSLWDLDEGWYSVGQLTDTRTLDELGRNLREFTLPMTPVDEPVTFQGAQWAYVDDLIRNATYADSLDEFPTYYDRLVGPSS